MMSGRGYCVPSLEPSRIQGSQTASLESHATRIMKRGILRVPAFLVNVVSNHRKEGDEAGSNEIKLGLTMGITGE